ncbi:T-lymphocyte activation antigen CD86-like isoform 1-T1 [Odontesthes bonariensis]|uniref:T-lymphocyte activation antigen CD86-like n=1 Tax=Odontesthes bonariensis TaxID=219752 RepID=UPI003F58736F
MASNCRTQNSLFLRSPRLRLCQLALVLTQFLTVIGNSSKHHYTEEIGGNVTFQCPRKDDQNRILKFLYFQQGNVFINGFHDTKPVGNIWPNTIFDRDSSTLQMLNLNISHIGDYQCIIMYSDDGNNIEYEIYLNVTAPYSKPSVTSSCKEENGVLGCQVTCSSHDGYPRQQIQWKTHPPTNVNHQIIKNNSDSHPITELFNISSTVYINCSSREQKLSCFVGNTTSDTFSVCPPVVQPDHSNTYVISAVIVVVLVLVVVVVVLCLKLKKRKEGPEEDNVRGNELEEAIVLTESRGRPEAS